MRRKQLFFGIGIALLAVCSGCATTGLGRSWAPADVREISFTRLAVVALTQQEAYRIQAEDALVMELGRVGVASHTLVPSRTSLRDTAAVVDALRKAGCDGVVTLQLTSGPVRPAVSGVPTAPQASVGQHVDDYWVDPAQQSTASFADGQHYSVEVHIFDLGTGDLVYNCLAIEKNAKDAADLVHRVRGDVRRDMQKRGLIAR